MQIDENHCEDCAELVKYFEGEDYTDYPQWTDFILKWNKAQEVMGIKQTLYVLRWDLIGVSLCLVYILIDTLNS